MPADGGVVTGSGRSRRVAMVAIALLALGAGAGGALRWAMVPDGYDGRVRFLSRSVDGDAFVNVGIGRATNVSVYQDVVDRLGGPEAMVGQRIEKDPWSTTVRIGGRPTSLAPPWEFYRFTGVLVVLLAVALARWWRHGASGGPTSDDRRRSRVSGRGWR